MPEPTFVVAGSVPVGAHRIVAIPNPPSVTVSGQPVAVPTRSAVVRDSDRTFSLTLATYPGVTYFLYPAGSSVFQPVTFNAPAAGATLLLADLLAGQTPPSGSGTPITATPVSFNEANRSYTIPSMTGVVYKTGAITKPPGQYAASGTVIVSAFATSGYQLTGQNVFIHTFPVVLISADNAAEIVSSIVDGAPTTLDTLNELSAAIGDNPNFLATITAALASKVDLDDYETALGHKADLIGGKIPNDQLSPLSTHETVSVVNKATMLTLTSTQVQPGDMVVIGSTGAAVDRGLWLLTTTPASDINSWLHLDLGGAVTSVNNLTGAVTLTAANVGAATTSQGAKADTAVQPQALTDGLATRAAIATERDARRERITDLARYGRGRWWVHRPLISHLTREYHFVRDLGDSTYLGVSFEDDVTDPGSTRTLRTKTAVVGPLVRMVNGNDATYSASPAWQHLPPTDITLGFKPERVVVNATAGDAFVDIPAGGLTAALHASRRITVVGAGAGGADLQLTTGTVASSTRVNLTGGTVGTTVTGAQGTFWSRTRRGDTLGQTASWTTPSPATVVGMASVRHTTSAGLMRVKIDTDPTLATNLQTAQQVVTSGRYPNTILAANGGPCQPTDRVTDFAANGLQYVEPMVFAENLSLATHTVVVEPLGIAGPGMTAGSVGARVFVAAWLWADGTETPASLAGSDWRVGERALLSFDAANDASVEHDGGGAGAQTFTGAKHGYETTSSLTFWVDGIQVTPAAGSVTTGGRIEIRKVTQLQHPNATSTNFFRVSYTYSLDPEGIRLRKFTRTLVATNVGHDYPVMLSYNGYLLTRAQVDASPTVLVLTAGNDSKNGTSKSTSIVAWENNGDHFGALIMPTADRITANWSDLTLTNIQDRSPLPLFGYKINKAYIGRSPGAVAVGKTWDDEAIMVWGRVAGGIGSGLPLT